MSDPRPVAAAGHMYGSFYDAVDASIEKLGPVAKRVMKRRMARPRYREQMCDELFAQMDNEVELQVFQDSPEVQILFDIDKFTKLVELIMKYLPLILKLFGIGI